MSIARRGGANSVLLISGGAGNPGVYAGTVDPSAGGGVAAAEGSIYERYVGAGGQLWLKTGAAATAWTQITPAGGGTLDQAYDFGGPGAGRTITVDAGAVVLDADADTTTPALSITRQPVTDANVAAGIEVTMGSKTCGHGLRITSAIEIASGHPIDVYHNGSSEYGVYVDWASGRTLQTWAFGAWIEGDSLSSGLRIYESDVARSTPMVQFARSTAATGHVLDIDNNATATARSINIDHEGSADSVYVDNAGTGSSVKAHTTGAGSNSFYAEHSGTADSAFRAALATANNNYGLRITEDAVARTTPMASLARDAAATGHVVDIDNNATATSRSINIDHEGTGVGIYVDHTNANAAAAIEISRVPSGAAGSIGIAITMGANAAGHGIEITANGPVQAFSTTLSSATDGAQAFVATETQASTVAMVSLTRVGTSTGSVIDIHNDGITNSCSLYINHDGDYYGILEYYQGDVYAASIHLDGTGTLQGGVRIKDESNTAKTSQLLYLERSAASLGASLYMDHNATGTAHAIQLAYAGAGDAIHVELDGAQVGAQGLVISDVANLAYNVAQVKLTRLSNGLGPVLQIDNDATGACDSLFIEHTGTGSGIYVNAAGAGDAIYVAAGTVRFGTYAAKGAEAFDGFITIKDAAGNSRKLMTCA